MSTFGLERIRIVLVRPQGPLNLGATCRAMKNMGLRELVLVSPRCRVDDEQAVALATRAADVLSAARVVDDLSAALDGCCATFATSGKGGFHRSRVAVDVEAGARLALERAGQGRVAIAFGPEDRGLLQKEILAFDRVIEIPADPEYPVLNLAAAVMVVAWELRSTALRMEGARPIASPDPPADERQKQAMFEKLYQALEAIGFFASSNDPDHLKYAIRRILGRADLSVNEADILIGLARQIQRGVRDEKSIDSGRPNQ